MVPAGFALNDTGNVGILPVIFSEAVVKLNDLAAPLNAANEADKKLLSDANVAGESLAAKESEIQDFIKKK